jgi:hypothetical protein
MTILQESTCPDVDNSTRGLFLDTLDNIDAPMTDMEKGICAGVICGCIVVLVILACLCL